MNKERIGVVYMILSIVHPDRCYVGSSVCIKNRWSTHRRELRTQKHHSIKLQAHYNKHGENDISFVIIESFPFISKKHLMDRERVFMRLLKYEGDNKPFFNMCPEPDSALGVKHTEETNRRKSERQRGKKRPPFTEEHRLNLGLAHKGLPFIRKPQHYKKGQPSTFKGKHHTEEAKQKNREKHLGSHDAVMRGVETRRKNGKIAKRDAKGHFMKKDW